MKHIRTLSFPLFGLFQNGDLLALQRFLVSRGGSFQVNKTRCLLISSAPSTSCARATISSRAATWQPLMPRTQRTARSHGLVAWWKLAGAAREVGGCGVASKHSFSERAARSAVRRTREEEKRPWHPPASRVCGRGLQVSTVSDARSIASEA